MKPFVLDLKDFFSSTCKNCNKKFKLFEKRYVVSYGEFLEIKICCDCAKSAEEAHNLSSKFIESSRPEAPNTIKL